MQRLFVALRPPPEVREALLATMGGVEGARWQNDNQLHITLAFMGALNRHQAEAATDALATIISPPLTPKLGTLGSFDSRSESRTAALWIGVEPVGPLTMLATAIRQALRRADIHVESRRFIPHITLARFSGQGAHRETLRPWLSHASPLMLSFQANAFHLVESYMGTGGSHYEPLAAYALTGSPDLTGSFGDQYPPQP